MTLQYNSSLHLKDTDKARQFKSRSVHGSIFLERVLIPVSQDFSDVLKGSSRGRKPLFITALEPLDPEVIALTVLTVCLDSLTEPVGKLTLASRVSQYLEQEINYSTLEASQPGLISSIHKSVKNHRARKRIDDAIKGGKFGQVQDDLVVWTQETKHTVGITLLEILVSTGLLDVVRTPGSRTNKYSWSPEIQSWASDAYNDSLFYSPAYLPLTEEPEGYVNTDKGPVEDSYGSLFPAVKFRLGANRNSAKEPADLNNGINIETANELAKVPYQINEPLLSAVEQLWDAGIEVGHLPTKENIEIPTYPLQGYKKDELTEDQEQQLKEWKSIASKTHIKNAHSFGLRMYIHRQLAIMRGFTDTSLYFLWQADSRGRLYPLATTLLNPQGHDLSKALLKFHSSRATKLGKEGVKELLKAIAEHYGIDKVSMNDRYEWSIESLSLLVEVASNPLGTIEFWSEADSPFQFLAACIELLSSFQSIASNEHINELAIGNRLDELLGSIEGYKSSYIRYLDGKCSGVQHWSSLLRDRDTASRVALTESNDDQVPPDIYSDVLVSLIDSLNTPDESLVNQELSEPIKGFWKELAKEGLLDRKLVKSPTMTYVYGSTQRAWTHHVSDWLATLMNSNPHIKLPVLPSAATDHRNSNGSLESIEGDEENLGLVRFKASSWLSNRIDLVLKKDLYSVATGMRWVKTAVQAINKTGTDRVTWKTPGCFEVVQAYRKSDVSPISIESKALNIRVKVSKSVLTDEVDKRRQTSAIAPNYIHSLDATHLCMTALEAVASELPVTVIHDSFGSLLGNTDKLSSIIKTNYSSLYSLDVLSGLREQWSELYPDAELPELPEYGDWSSDMVLNSSYAFS